MYVIDLGREICNDYWMATTIAEEAKIPALEGARNCENGRMKASKAVRTRWRRTSRALSAAKRLAEPRRTPGNALD